MEPREIVAYSLGAILVFVILAVIWRYRHNRKQFKLRQTGKGKSIAVGDDPPKR
jgi:cytochrome c biogenesis protein CcdA